MTELRMQVITRRASDLPVDHIVNTLYFDTDSPFTFIDQALEGVNETQLCIDLRNVFNDRWYTGTGYGTEVKCYDMSDPLPRRVRGHANWAASTGQGNGATGPREVALCLSMRGQVNSARTRGRLFIGPFAGSALSERPNDPTRTKLLELATAIGNVGGVNIDWCVRSTITGDQVPVKLAWVDNEWDTIRSRGLKPTSRLTATLNE